MHWKHDTWHIDTGPGPLSCSKQNIHKIHWWQTINVKIKSQETKCSTLYCKWSQPVHYNATLILLSVRGAAQGPSPHRLGTGLMRIIQRKQGSCCPATACRVPGCPHRCLEPGSGKTSSLLTLLLHVPMTHLGAVCCWTCSSKSFHPLGVLVDNRKAKSR